MAGIIEPQEPETAPFGLGVEGGRLGRAHVGAIAAEPNDGWGPGPHWRAAAKGDTPLIRGFPDDEELRLTVRHLELAANDATRGPRPCEPRPRRARQSSLGRAGAASQPPAHCKARGDVSVDALTPFGRGANAPLAGRTILQIVPPVDAGGDERSTLAVTAALAEAGARALVASDSGELAGELQAIGGLFVQFPAATKNPLALTLNMRRLQRIIASERVDLVHTRSRWAAWAAVKACRKAKRPLVTSLIGDGGRSPPRTSFETAVAEGDLVIAGSEFAAQRAADVFPAARLRLRIVRPGLDLAKLQPERVSGGRVADVRQAWGVAAHERVVLTPARLAPGRGQPTLIEAAALIKSRGLYDVRFVLAGDAAKPAFAREIDALAVKCGVQSMLARVGAAADLPAAFIAAAVVVFPAAEADGVTRTPIEAAAMGALTIMTDVGPAREIIAAPPHADADARTGWLAQPRDALALAEAIEAALGLGASGREAVRRRSRAKIIEAFSLERMTHDTLGVYAEALGG
jgi:glycosyltransferase involved in cell wall biosynthesis